MVIPSTAFTHRLKPNEVMGFITALADDLTASTTELLSTRKQVTPLLPLRKFQHICQSHCSFEEEISHANSPAFTASAAFATPQSPAAFDTICLINCCRSLLATTSTLSICLRSLQQRRGYLNLISASGNSLGQLRAALIENDLAAGNIVYHHIAPLPKLSDLCAAIEKNRGTVVAIIKESLIIDCTAPAAIDEALLLLEQLGLISLLEAHYSPPPPPPPLLPPAPQSHHPSSRDIISRLLADLSTLDLEIVGLTCSAPHCT